MRCEGEERVLKRRRVGWVWCVIKQKEVGVKSFELFLRKNKCKGMLISLSIDISKIRWSVIIIVTFLPLFCICSKVVLHVQIFGCKGQKAILYMHAFSFSHIHTNTNTNLNMHKHVHIHSYVCVYIYDHHEIDVSVYVYGHTCISWKSCVHMYMYMNVCMFLTWTSKNIFMLLLPF